MERAEPALALSDAIERRSLGQAVADRLRQEIVAGAIRPGQRLREAELSARYQVSRSPIRDAFNRLSAEKLLLVRPHRGAVVATMPLQDMEEVYTLRLTLEVLAVRLAIARASAADIAALRSLAERRPRETGPRTAQEFAELDVAFHDLVYRAAQHERLYGAWSLLRPHILRFLVWRNMVNGDFREVYGAEHKELVEALVAGDVSAATAMVSHHLEGAYVRLVEAYQRQERSLAEAAEAGRRSQERGPRKRRSPGGHGL